MRHGASFLSIAILVTTSSAFAQTAPDASAPPAPTPAPVSATPAPAPAPSAAPSAAPAATTTTATTTAVEPERVAAASKSDKQFVFGKYSASLYGFVELDTIHDSTESFADLAGNGAIAKPGSYAGDHGRTTFGVRNSRLGFKVGGPESDTIRTSAVLEMDFFGNQPPNASEAAFFGNPTFRIRHFNFKVETPVVDLLFGQSWQLFGWQSSFHPATVEIQGVPGQVYSRAAQVRLSKRVHTSAVDVEFAAAAARSPQRDGSMPDFQGGVRMMVNDWKGWHTAGAAGTAVDALSIGVSGVYRKFTLPEFSATPSSTNSTPGYGVSIDALLPIVPATAEHNENALTLNGSFVTGQGIADLFTGLTGGVSFPALPGGGTTPYAPNIDSGLVSYDGNGVLHAITWRSVLVGVQYHLPVGGLWVSANYSNMKSSNSTDFGGAKAFDKSQWADGNLFWDATKAVRFGGEYAYFEQTYGDGTKAKNHRVQLSAFYLF